MSKRISRKTQRELGILPRQILTRAREMAKDNVIEKDMTVRELAFAVMADVSNDGTYNEIWDSVVSGSYGVDWDALLEFIERVLELILKFLPLFI